METSNLALRNWPFTLLAKIHRSTSPASYLTADAQAEAVLYQASLLGVDDAEVLG